MYEEPEERLTENPFFVELFESRTRDADRVDRDGHVICVPRAGSLSGLDRPLGQEDFLAHVLVPDVETADRYFALDGTAVTLDGNELTLPRDGSTLRVEVLFRELFYPDPESPSSKFTVWCVDSPLNRARSPRPPSPPPVRTLGDCVRLLWSRDGRPLSRIDRLVEAFTRSRPSYATVDGLVADVRDLYVRCSEATDLRIRGARAAVETYVLHAAHDTVMDALRELTARRDAALNGAARNLSELHPADLDIGEEFLRPILDAKTRLAEVRARASPTGKASRLKDALAAIADSRDRERSASADELLAAFAFLVVKSGVPDWHAQLIFARDFRFGSDPARRHDETSYALSTLEAAIEFVEKRLAGRERFLLPRNAGPPTTDLDRLLFAIERGDRDAVEKTLKDNSTETEELQRCDDAKNETDVRPSMDDILNEDVPSAAKTERLSVSIRARDAHGRTLLHAASKAGDPGVVDLLLECGARVGDVDTNESTPLHYAASGGHQNALLLLLHAGADPRSKNSIGNTPLHLACNNGHDSCVKALVYFSECFKANLRLNEENDNGDTPLHLASKWNYENIIYSLLESGADPYKSNTEGKTPMDYAHGGIVKNILQKDRRLFDNHSHSNNLHTKKSDTVITEDSVATFKNCKNNSLKTSPVRPKSTAEMRHLMRVFKAISFGDAELAYFYMDISARVSKIDGDTETEVSSEPCHPLCVCEKCVSLVERTFDVDTCDLHGDTALHVAARHGHTDICKVLLDNGAEADFQNERGIAPLHIAAHKGRRDIANLLMDRGADINLKDDQGNTCLHLACLSGNSEMLELLLGRVDEIHPLNDQRRTPLDIAKDKMLLSVIALYKNQTQ